jgi:hypothetical protein
MARIQVPITVIDLSGNGVSGAAVRVQNRVGGADATLYTSESGPTTAANPTTTDSYGRVSAWVTAPGQYNALVSGTGITSYTQPFDAVPGENFDVGNSKVGAGGWATGAFSARLASAFGTTTSYVAMTFATEDFDVSGWYNTGTGRFTPQIAGIYRVGMTLKADALATNFYVSAGIHKNGALIKEVQNTGVPNFTLGTTVQALVSMNGTTDYLYGASYGGSISSGSPTLQAGVSNSFFGELIGRA